MRRAGGAVALAGLVAACGARAGDCGADLGGAPARVSGARYDLAWVAHPHPIPLDRHFALELAVCPRAGTPQPAEVRVGATMPAHRHGMNYRPVVTLLRPGVWRAEGLLFHMGGRWELAFDLVGSGGVERLASPVEVD